MLKNINGKSVLKLEHAGQYNAWKKNLSASEFDAIVDEIDKLIDLSDGKFVTSWAKVDWDGPVFLPLAKACGNNKTKSSLFFGLICRDIFINRTFTSEEIKRIIEDWTFMKFKQDNREYSMYFLPEN